MADASVTLRRVDDATLSRVEALLERNDLPSDDLASSPGRFYLARAGRTLVGVGGLELYDGDALLRSVVVEQSVRGSGYGTAICDELEAEARAAGVETVYLLTTTATDFFADRGYVPVDRDDAPVEIRQTTEFAELCPSTAACLRKSL